jgi:hypothetical protein
VPQAKDLTVITSLTDDDLIVGWNNPGGAGDAAVITALNAKSYFGGSGGSYVTGLTAGDVGTYASANLTALQAALDAAEAAGGGRVVLPPGIYQFSGTANIGTRVTYAGTGWGSIHKLANGASTTGSPVPVLAAKGNSNYIGVEDLYIDGNKANQTDTNYVSNGIDFYTRGTTEGSGAPVYDGGLWCNNVMVYACKGVGFYVRGTTTTMRLTRCYSYHNDAQGFWTKTDQIASDCVAANNGYDGFYCYSGTSVLWTGLKAFGNGQRGSANRADFKIEYSNTVMLADCQAEDFSEAGFWITASNHVTLMGCHAYRGGGMGSPDSLCAGFRIEDDGGGNVCHDLTIIGDVLGGGTGGVPWAMSSRELGVDCYFHINSETMTSGVWNHFSGGTSNVRAIFDNYEAPLSNDQTGSNYTLVLTDLGKLAGITMSNASANTVTIPAHGSVPFPANTTFAVVQLGAGQTTITPDSGITVNSAVGLKLRARYSVAWVRKIGFPSNTWVAWGDLVP